MSDLPVVKSAADAKQHDGQRVRLVGLYRKRMTARKMGGPTSFEGYVEIELEGARAEYDPKTAPHVKATVRLGRDPRPDDEIAALAVALVSVEGKLLSSPQSLVKEEAARQRRARSSSSPAPSRARRRREVA